MRFIEISGRERKTCFAGQAIRKTTHPSPQLLVPDTGVLCASEMIDLISPLVPEAVPCPWEMKGLAAPLQHSLIFFLGALSELAPPFLCFLFVYVVEPRL